MRASNEEIARAAGLYGISVNRDTPAQEVDWHNDPGECALWLLPVLEERVPTLNFGRMENSSCGLWYAQGAAGDKPLSAVHSDSWHACVIAAILATAP